MADPAAPAAAPAAPATAMLDSPGLAPLMAVVPPSLRIQSENLIKAGFSVAAVVKSLVDAGYRAPTVPEGEEPRADARSPAQRQHDNAWNVSPVIDPASYHFQPRGDVDAKSQQISQLETDARGFLSAAGFDPRAGASLVDTVLTLAKQGMAMGPEERAATPQKWERDGRAILGTRYDAALTDARNLLKSAGDNALAADLIATGLLRNPAILIPLHNRSAALKAWREGRPVK